MERQQAYSSNGQFVVDDFMALLGTCILHKCAYLCLVYEFAVMFNRLFLIYKSTNECMSVMFLAQGLFESFVAIERLKSRL